MKWYRVVRPMIRRSLRAMPLSRAARMLRSMQQAVDQAAMANNAPPARAAAPVGTGRFVQRAFTDDAGGRRSYKLYLPSALDGAPRPALPLVLMLHGCTQTPDDFAVGTRMNEHAERHGFIVAYPAQPRRANASRCWNWFRPQDQMRGHGEPATLAGITRAVLAEFGADAERTYVAGLSAGAAMAVVLGRTYPDVYAAVGCHSGLPYAAATDVPSAFRVMRHGTARDARASNDTTHEPMPTIVFHGAQDETVAPDNGLQVALEAAATQRDAHDAAPETLDVERGSASCKRTTYYAASGGTRVEHWLLHGVGHSWSGGCPTGSHTDPAGIDASAEMIRFFLTHRRAA